MVWVEVAYVVTLAKTINMTNIAEELRQLSILIDLFFLSITCR